MYVLYIERSCHDSMLSGLKILNRLLVSLCEKVAAWSKITRWYQKEVSQVQVPTPCIRLDVRREADVPGCNGINYST